MYNFFNAFKFITTKKKDSTCSRMYDEFSQIHVQNEKKKCFL